MIPRSNSHHSGDGKRREVIRIHLNVILAMGITRLKAWYGNSMPVRPQTYVETPYVWLVCNFVRRNSHHTTKMSWMVWAGQSLHMSPVWNYVIYWGMMTPWIDSLALRKKGTRTKKKVSDHHCYFKIAVWGIPQLRANQSHVVSVIPCPIRSLFYPIIPPWHPHFIYIYMLSYLKKHVSL